jgi:tol-pal system protein YbgF
MRLRISILTAAMLLASPFVVAQQRASLADRVALLEQRAAGDQNASELVNQITQLRAEAQELRGLIEELQQQLEQARQGQRAQYLDLSGRLDQLEGRSANTANVPTATVDTSNPPASSSPPPATPAASSKPAVTEQAAYEQAFNALKRSEYVESARLFRDFLTTYPGGVLAPNALYWLGESYYVTQNYALAGEQFRALLDRFPTSDKAPGALLKLGLAQYGLRQFDAASTTLQQVMQRYPGTDTARTAEDRLRAISSTSNR